MILDVSYRNCRLFMDKNLRIWYTLVTIIMPVLVLAVFPVE